jgi:hypothetical protein
MPGLSTGAIALTRVAADKGVLEVLDASGKAFIRSSSDGWWVNVGHPWFKDMGLFLNTQNPDTRGDWGPSWVKASGSLMLTYQDPRLQAPKGQARAVRHWSIPVRAMDNPKSELIAGDMQWREVTEKREARAR